MKIDFLKNNSKLIYLTGEINKKTKKDILSCQKLLKDC